MTQGPSLHSIDPRYKIVLSGCITQFTVIGLLFTYGLFFKVFETEFGWSRTLLSASNSAAFFMMGVLAMAVGRLNDKYGPRIVLTVSGVIYGCGYLLMSLVNAPWQLFVVFGVFVSLGMASHDVVTLSTIARWFPRRRGIMTGVVKVGTAVGQMVMPPIAALLILHQGWETALLIMGGVGIILLVGAASLMSDPPRTATTGSTESSNGLSFDEAKRSRTLWTFCAIQFLFFPTMMSVPLHIAVHGMDLGMTAAKAALLLSVMGASSIAGRLAIGALTDKIGSRLSYAFCLIPLIASLIALALITKHEILYLILAAYGFGHGGLFTVVSPAVAEYFGLRAHGAIFGTIMFFGTIGGAIGPIMAGWIFDVNGSYFYAFITLAVLAGIALMLAISLPKSPNRQHN